MLLTRIWGAQPGAYFCISTKDRDGEWHDEFFSRKQFALVQAYIDEKKEEKNDVYWCPHGFNKKRRLQRYAEMPKLLWADLDEVDPRGLGELKPSVAWESSPGRFACLWILDETLDEDTTNQKLTYHIGADHGGWDLTQVLRVPGTNNYKYPAAPRVRLLWQDGKSFTLDQIKRQLPKSKERPETGTPNVNAIFKKYRAHLTPWARRELLNGKPRRGTRSEVFWKLTNEILEAGADEKEAFEILWASPWNKFKDRRDGMKQLNREIEKVYGSKLDGINPQQEYEEKADLPDEEDDGDETPESEILKSFLGIAEKETPRWVIYPYLARGHITSIEGDPEVGKSWFCLGMGAAISEGKKFVPTDGWEDSNERGAVFYFDAENDIGNVAQRMEDSDMFTHVKNPHDQAPFFHVKMRVDFREEEAIDQIRDRIKATLKLYKNNKKYDTKVSLILFDTFINFSGDTDTNKQSDVMNALGNLKTLAEEEDCPVAIIRHYGKTQHANSMHRGMGSTQFAATCRAMLGVHRHPDDPDTRVVTISKSSLASKSDLRALSYSLEPVFPGATDTALRDRTRMRWGKWLDLNDYEIVAASKDAPQKQKEAKAERTRMTGVLEEMFASKMKVPVKELEARFEREAFVIKNLPLELRRLGYTMIGRGDSRFYKKAPTTLE